MVDDKQFARWEVALHKIQQLRTIVDRNRRNLVDSEINVVSTFRDLATTEADLNNREHAHRLIRSALHAIRVARGHMPGLPDEVVDETNDQLNQLQTDLLGLRKVLQKMAAAESTKTVQRTPAASVRKKRVRSKAPASNSARRSRVRH